MTPDEETPCPESTPRDDAGLYDAPDRDDPPGLYDAPSLYDAPDRETGQRDDWPVFEADERHACVDLSDPGDGAHDAGGVGGIDLSDPGDGERGASGTGGIDLSDTGDAGADEAGWQIHEPLDDDRYDGRYGECHDDDGRYDDEWGDHRWDRYDGYESLHQRHAPHDGLVFDQAAEPPDQDEPVDPLDAAEREAEAAEPDAFRWFRQDADESA